ncbi:hypothetical protein GCM10009087_03810 [Sphingomonas oligophenolica]|uniref:Winged helix-turn-helix domain-containing protein n=1 Tax=Sphingomonas oligophenolica TaxID=301154 RepID=A0ABU9Y691_9SPHN
MDLADRPGGSKGAAMTLSLNARAGAMTGVIAVLAVALALLALGAAMRLDRAVEQLVLSQGQLDSALRLRAAPYLPGSDAPRLLDLYGAQIEAEDRMASTPRDHERQRGERSDLERLRRIMSADRASPALDALTGRIVEREQAETLDARRELARTERMIAVVAAIIALILLVCAALFVAVLRRSILRPIRLLTAAVATLRDGGTAPVPLSGLAPEFGLLAGGFNAMAAHIRAQHDQLQAMNETLEDRVAARTRALAEAMGLRFDRDMRMLSCNGKEIALTDREAALLGFLLERKGRTVSRAQILQAAWQASEEASDNLVDVYVGYLRRKLGAIEAPWEIATVRGAGFVLRERR